MKLWVQRACSAILTTCLLAGTLPGMALAADDASLPEETSVNLALNRPVTCSSWTKDDRENGEHNPERAVDGKTAADDQDSRWASSSSDNQWISIDLGQTCYINKVILQWETARASTYRLEVSSDNSKWTTIYTHTGGTKNPNTVSAAKGSVDTITVFDQAMTGRYIRMYGVSRTTTYGFSIYEFEVYGQQNQAQNKTAVASSIDNNQHPVAGVVDGDMSTRWASSSTDDQWVYVDLGQTYRVTAVALKWESAYGKAYKLQVSNDAQKWTDIYETSDGKGGNELMEMAESSMTGRYVRMQGVSRATRWGYSLYEFEIYGSPSLTHGKPATASRVENDAHSADKAFDSDSNKDSRWSSNGSSNPNQWLYVDLQGIYRLDAVVLKWEAAYGKAYTLQVSNDAKEWTDIYETANGNGGNEIIPVEAVGRYVRMQGVTPSGTYGYSLYEMEAYGTLVEDVSFQVMFTDKFEQEVYTTTVYSAEELDVLLKEVKAPALGGYTFCGWDENEAAAIYNANQGNKEAYPIAPVYSVGDNAGQRTKYTVTIGGDIQQVDSTIDLQSICFDDRVELKLADGATKDVAYWVLDGQKMAYGENKFIFYVTGNNSVSVVLNDGSEVTPEASVNIQQYATQYNERNNTYVLSAIAQTYVPEGSKATEYGMYYTATVANLKDIQAEKCTPERYVQVVSTKTGNNEQYMTHLLGVESGCYRYAMAYANVTDANGNTTTVYSPYVFQFHTETKPNTITVKKGTIA